jgi:hypothetical protein
LDTVASLYEIIFSFKSLAIRVLYCTLNIKSTEWADARERDEGERRRAIVLWWDYDDPVR